MGIKKSGQDNRHLFNEKAINEVGINFFCHLLVPAAIKPLVLQGVEAAY